MLLNYVPRFTLNQVVENHLKHRTKILQNNIQNLLKVQNKPKIQADKRRKDKKYKEGDWVYLKH
jgi:LytS/YehU family sensor histidine kinase